MPGKLQTKGSVKILLAKDDEEEGSLGLMAIANMQTLKADMKKKMSRMTFEKSGMTMGDDTTEGSAPSVAIGGALGERAVHADDVDPDAKLEPLPIMTLADKHLKDFASTEFNAKNTHEKLLAGTVRILINAAKLEAETHDFLVATNLLKLANQLSPMPAELHKNVAKAMAKVRLSRIHTDTHQHTQAHTHRHTTRRAHACDSCPPLLHFPLPPPLSKGWRLQRVCQGPARSGTAHHGHAGH